MAGVQANWFVDLEIDEQDPFAEIAKVGRRIDLRDPEDLNRQLTTLLNEETRLLHEGVSCPIKDANGSCCAVCPMRARDVSPMGRLCSVGVEQERVVTMLVIHRERENGSIQD